MQVALLDDMRTLHHALWTQTAAGSSSPESKIVNEMRGLNEKLFCFYIYTKM
jgi:hypothetical protein